MVNFKCFNNGFILIYNDNVDELYNLESNMPNTLETDISSSIKPIQNSNQNDTNGCHNRNNVNWNNIKNTCFGSRNKNKEK